MNKYKQSGMTILELMIAGALGVIIAYFIMSIMMGSARSANLSEGTAQAQENARLVTDWLNETIPIGGYNSDYMSEATAGFTPLAPLCTTSAIPPNDGANCTYNSDSNINGGDRLAIRRTVGGETAVSRDLQTCGGEILHDSITSLHKTVIDVYWVEPVGSTDNPADINQLKCVTYDSYGIRQGSAHTIAHGIESMQILAGIGTPDGKMQKYISPDEVENWDEVTAVRIALLAREFGDHTLAPEPRMYGLLDSIPIEFNDGAARIVQNDTIWFPNTKAN